MKSFKKIQLVLSILFVMMVVMAVPVMAQDHSTGITPPGIIRLAPVSLSPELREKYSEQTILVKLKATITESGTTADDIQVVTSSNDAAFDQAVIESLKQSVFSPAYKDHQAVACTIVLPLHVKVEKYLPEEPASNMPGHSDGQQ